jgi:hypothetical protein
MIVLVMVVTAGKMAALNSRPWGLAQGAWRTILPGGWHRRQEWLNLFEAACGPPATAA